MFKDVIQFFLPNLQLTIIVNKQNDVNKTIHKTTFIWQGPQVWNNSPKIEKLNKLVCNYLAISEHKLINRYNTKSKLLMLLIICSFVQINILQCIKKKEISSYQFSFLFKLVWSAFFLTILFLLTDSMLMAFIL